MRSLLLVLLMVALCGCGTMPSNLDFGAQYIGVQYVRDPLGEGASPDSDPLIRTDAFDCTTFVETVLANGDVSQLNKIRYRDGVVDIKNRNHFIETDWITNNSDLVENASGKYARTEIRHVIIDKKSWFKKIYDIDTDFAPMAVGLEYIPYQDLPVFNNTKPLIVLFIVGNSKKYDKIGTDIAVVHMGVLMPGGILRHASSTQKRVLDTDFYEYVKLRQKIKNNIGISILEIK